MATHGLLGIVIFCFVSNVMLSQAEFEKLHEVIKPSNDPWKSIPWQTSLVDAQNQAASEKKPLFIWAMDGHPLGCT